MLDRYLIKTEYIHLNSQLLDNLAAMKKVLILLLFPVCIFGQGDLGDVETNGSNNFKKDIKERKDLAENKQDTVKEPGEFNVVLADQRIGVLDDYVKANPLRLTGFRIQLVFGNRSTVNNAKSKFYGNYSEVSIYESYLAPNFRLRVGDFLTRLQAEEFLNSVKGYFPGAYIVNDKINVPSYLKNGF